ncbi:MAG: HAD-IG family 5'-nucleotidase [Deltaproteobacteria bacterium]|nr:HAD-IG family 5'-nucleotidase [Deltaproteobacteria bacterium]
MSQPDLGLRYERRIFVNRATALDEIEAIGFDMDYTLCPYKPELEVLATELAIGHLVRRGYPESLRQVRFDPEFCIRGLVIDTARGNVVKMDAHRHVTRVWHGMRALSDEERRALYHADPPRLSAERWAMTDTLFSTPESFLYCVLVDMIETETGKPMDSPETRRLYADIRYCIDLVHRDDSLKSAVRADLARYIDLDPELPHALHRLRSAGKTLFILTNSDMSYTEAVMSYLLDGKLPDYKNWQDYFHLVWVTARKPAFFESLAEPFKISEKVYDQGSRPWLEKALGGISGDRILYVGDHIYGDVLKSKSTTGWRTALIVPELEAELHWLAVEAAAIAERGELEDERFDLETTLASAEMSLRAARRAERRGAEEDGESVPKPQPGGNVYRDTLRALVSDMRARLERNAARVAELTTQVEQHHSPRWGQLLKERHKHSLFGAQMANYACLYTSRVSNFVAYSPHHAFEPPRDLLPHERVIRLAGPRDEVPPAA